MSRAKPRALKRGEIRTSCKKVVTIDKDEEQAVWFDIEFSDGLKTQWVLREGEPVVLRDEPYKVEAV